MILIFRAEMLLRLGKVDHAKETIRRAAALESKLPSSFKSFGMLPEAYLCDVDAQIELAIGRKYLCTERKVSKPKLHDTPASTSVQMPTISVSNSDNAVPTTGEEQVEVKKDPQPVKVTKRVASINQAALFFSFLLNTRVINESIKQRTSNMCQKW